MIDWKCLVVIEVSQKQRYIFSSNKLREIIGASITVAKVTKEALIEAFCEYKDGTIEGVQSIPERTKEQAIKYVEKVLLFNGGGKSVYQFSSNEEATAFIKITSLYLLKNYIGVEVFYGKYVREEKDSEIGAIDKLYASLERQKSRRKQSFQFYGTGLSPKCPSTSMPINVLGKNLDKDFIEYLNKFGIDNGKKIIQSDSKKLDTYGNNGFNDVVYTKLKGVITQEDTYKIYLNGNSNYRFPTSFEELGGTKFEKNKIAVLVVDGNRMGKRIENIKESLIQTGQVQYFLEAEKIFSEYISEVFEGAIKDVVAKFIESKNELCKKLSLKEGMLPIRPLIAAGDDICLLADARIGLWLLVELLKAVRKESKDKRKYYIEEKIVKEGLPSEWFQKAVTEDGLYASGGMILCGTKYPFSRARKLAEDLCSNAKEENADEEQDRSLIDFHVAMGEVKESIGEEREYRNLYDNIHTLKPYVVDQSDTIKYEKKNNFSNFLVALGKIRKMEQNSEEGESSQKQGTGLSKVKELAYYIRQGNDVATSFINHAEGRLNQQLNFDGFIGMEAESKEKDYSIFLDVIEMLDYTEGLEAEK